MLWWDWQTSPRVVRLQLPRRGERGKLSHDTTDSFSVGNIDFCVFTGKSHVWRLQHRATWYINQLLLQHASDPDTPFVHSRQSVHHHRYVALKQESTGRWKVQPSLVAKIWPFLGLSCKYHRAKEQKLNFIRCFWFVSAKPLTLITAKLRNAQELSPRCILSNEHKGAMRALYILTESAWNTSPEVESNFIYLTTIHVCVSDIQISRQQLRTTTG